MTDLPDSEAAYFRFFARTAASHGSPLYARLAHAVAEDASLLALTTERRTGQPSANLLFAAVHFLLLGGVDHPLRRFYPTIGGACAVDDDAVPQFRAFCAQHHDDIVALIRARVTNTNEVQRCAALAPGLCDVARATQRPLALIELGPSAGLNLNFDRYAYRYAGKGGDSLAWGPSALTIECALRGSRPPLPERAPQVAWRRGVELNRVDLSDADDRLWLKALIWPDRVDRLRRLESALDIARFAPPEIEIGDAAARLPAIIDAARQDAALCIFHSAFLYQLPGETRTRLDDICKDASLARPIWRLSFDWAGVEGETPLTLQRWNRGEVAATHLADTDDHGQWINWFA